MILDRAIVEIADRQKDWTTLGQVDGLCNISV